MSLQEQKKEKDYIPEEYVNLPGNQLLCSVLTLVQDGICFLSRDLDVLYANPAMRYWYGWDERTDGEKCYSIFHNRGSVCENCPALRAMQTGELEMEERVYQIDRKKKGMHRLFCLPIRDPGGETILLLEYVRDVTDESRKDLSLSLMQAQMDNLTDLIRQKEIESHQKEKAIYNNIHRSIDMVLRYLNKVLDAESYQLIKDNLSVRNSEMGRRHGVHTILSGQELEVARYIAQGYLSKEIADKMHLSKKTVDFHRTNMRKKLGLKEKDSLKHTLQRYFERMEI